MYRISEVVEDVTVGSGGFQRCFTGSDRVHMVTEVFYGASIGFHFRRVLGRNSQNLL